MDQDPAEVLRQVTQPFTITTLSTADCNLIEQALYTEVKKARGLAERSKWATGKESHTRRADMYEEVVAKVRRARLDEQARRDSFVNREMRKEPDKRDPASEVAMLADVALHGSGEIGLENAKNLFSGTLGLIGMTPEEAEASLAEALDPNNPADAALLDFVRGRQS